MQKTLSTIAVVALLIGGYSAANGYPMVMPAENTQPAMQLPMEDGQEDKRVQPVYPTVSYKFDEKAAKDILAQPSLILEVKCNGKAVLAAM